MHPSSRAISHTRWPGLIWPCTCLCLANLADHLSGAEGSWCFKGKHQGSTECCEEAAKAVILFTADTKSCVASLLHSALGGLFCGKKNVFLIACIAAFAMYKCVDKLAKDLTLPASLSLWLYIPCSLHTVCFYLEKKCKKKRLFFFPTSEVQFRASWDFIQARDIVNQLQRFSSDCYIP